MSTWLDITKKPGRVPAAVKRLIDDFQTKPNIRRVLESWVGSVKLTDDSTVDVIDARILSAATGVRLDLLGALVGQARKGLGDAAYAAAIRTRIRANRSQATMTDLYEVIALMWSGYWRLIETPYGAYRTIFRDVAPELQGVLRDILTAVRPLGHQGELSYTPLPAARTLRFRQSTQAVGSGVPPFNAGQAGSSSRFAHAERLTFS